MFLLSSQHRSHKGTARLAIYMETGRTGTPQNKITPLSPRTLAVVEGKKKSSSLSRGWCRSFTDCMIMGSTVSTSRPSASTHKLNHQVEELEKEVKKQTELRGMYRMRLERTQDYLRYCLKVAQENGFLELILNRKDHQAARGETSNSSAPFSPASTTILTASTCPQTPPPDQYNSDLSVLISHAKLNGWYIEPQEIELQEKVAQGSTADIYKGTWRGTDVAVKCLYPDFFNSNENGVSFFAQEVETLSRQRHRFVLQLMGACLDPPNHGWVVTEFLSMTLKDWLHGPGTRRSERVVPIPPFEERVAKALEIAQGLQYLHEHKPMLIHRDLKPSNIFLDDAFHVRVADFGHARFLTDGEKALTGETGTYVYMAPEVIRCEPYSEKCDVYSFGVILNELITGEYPYIESDYGPTKIAMQVGEGKIRPALPEYDEQLEDLTELIQLSWDEDPEIRPSFATITRTLKMIQSRFIYPL